MQKALTFSRHNLQIETTTAVNFLGPMLLTELLLPLLEQNGGGRVVYVSSEAHRAGQMFVEAAQSGARLAGSLKGRLLAAVKAVNSGKEGASGPLAGAEPIANFRRYGMSKLLGTYYTHHVARRYRTAPAQSRVVACSLHPGCVVTNFSNKLLGGEHALPARIFRSVGLLFFKSCEEGAQTTLHCAMCPKEELELEYPLPAKKGEAATKKPEDAVSRYFVECSAKTHSMLLPCGWDVEEAENVVAWGKGLIGV
ncbi:short-chain dehydrogenase [Strigomonas culicis]|nr:short-chain dehydrogenase [Strigomonas culicis]|eukprot:EPY36978.1 short-chain dehydrogenase [Strigomonas culicis]